MLAPQNRQEGCVYSLGYQMRQLPDFINLLLEAGVEAVIDVRQTPWSHRPGCSVKPLKEALTENAIEYIHAKFAGNPKALRSRASTHAESLELYAAHLAERPEIIEQLDETMRPWLSQGRNVCLICYERHPADCHRTVLAYGWQAAADDRNPVTHLGPDGAPRFTTFQIDSVAEFVSAALQVQL
jgi:uncharacterized protein (DUF488 family)